MSTWIKLGISDIDISDDGKDLEIKLEPDDSGNVYVEVEVKDIFELLQAKLKKK